MVDEGCTYKNCAGGVIFPRCVECVVKVFARWVKIFRFSVYNTVLNATHQKNVTITVCEQVLRFSTKNRTGFFSATRTSHIGSLWTPFSLPPLTCSTSPNSTTSFKKCVKILLGGQEKYTFLHGLFTFLKNYKRITLRL